MSLSPGTILNQQYSIERELGGGGFGVTYIGWDSQNNCRVAIKENFPSYLVQRDSSGQVLLYGDARSYRAVTRHFITEAEILTSLNHPNIVRGYGIIECFNTAYFIMEYIDGVSLDSYRRPSEWTEPSLTRILSPLLDAISYLHSMNICHRDIKPANIMVRPGGDPVLIDFGAAKYEPSAASFSIGFMSMGYTAPEQIADHDCLAPTLDIYALAATCYCLLTGAAPDPAPSRMLNPSHDTYVPLTSNAYLSNRFSTSFLSCIDRALSLNSAVRPTADEWLSTLQNSSFPLHRHHGPNLLDRVINSLSSFFAQKPNPLPPPPASTPDDEEVDIKTLLRWAGNTCYFVGGILLIGIILSFFTSGSAAGSLDSFLPFALACIICGVVCTIIQHFSDPSE